MTDQANFGKEAGKLRTRIAGKNVDIRMWKQELEELKKNYVEAYKELSDAINEAELDRATMQGKLKVYESIAPMEN